MQTICHLSALIHKQAEKYGNRIAITYKGFGETQWKTISWQHFSMRVKEVSNALLNIGIKPQEAIAVFSQNCVQYLYTDFGAYGVKAITVPFYATNSEQQIQYMINDAQVRVIFVGEQEQYDKAQRIFPRCASWERIVVYDEAVHIAEEETNAIHFSEFIKLGEGLPRQSELDILLRNVSNDDMCNILYTSGTTGESKGVMLTYGQYEAALRANGQCVNVSEKDRVIDFLPFTHIFERGWAYLGLTVGAQLIINTYPQEIQQSMRETHPTCMSAVPRFWEKVYVAVKDKIDRAGAIKQRLFAHALSVGKRYNVDYVMQGKRPPLALALEYKMIDRAMLSIVRKQIGLDHPNIFPTAGAAISPAIEQFVHAVGINMVAGYGLTESLATVSCDRGDQPCTIGSVGRVIDGLQIKIGENDEVLLKGPTITKGYYKRDNANQEAFDADGFFHTGDAGYIKNGELFLKERIKDLFKTSNGKYIAPQMVESMLLVDKYVDQIAIVAEERKFVSALLVPDFRLLEEYARQAGIPFTSREDLCNSPRINAMMMERVETLQQSLAHYEKVKRITLIPRAFSMESGELTSTLKLKRPVVYKNFKEIIDKMYEE